MTEATSQWLIGLIPMSVRVFLAFLLSFSTCYTMGYLHALGGDAFVFLDASVVSGLLFQATLGLSLGYVIILLVTRLSLNETTRNLTFYQQVVANPSISLPLGVLALVMAGTYLAPEYLLSNAWFPIVGIIFTYSTYFLYIPSRTGPITTLVRSRLVKNARPKLFRELRTRELTSFLKVNGIVFVFLFASWIGYSRAEFMMNLNAILIVDGIELNSRMAPVLFQSNGTVFVDEDDRFFRIANANFLLQKQTD